MASFYVNIDVEALFCRCSTRFNFHCVHSHGRIWNPPLRSANPVAFCLPPTSAGWGHPALRPTEKGERRAASPLAAVPACAVLRHPGSRTTFPRHAEGHRPVAKSLPCQREVPSLRGGGIPARLRRPPAPLLALRATSPGTGESVFDKGGFFAPTLNFTSNFTLAKSGKVCYNLIAYRFSGKYSRNPNQTRRVPPHVRTPVGNPCGFLW